MPAPATPTSRRRIRAARVAVDHDRPAVDPGLLRRRRRGAGHLRSQPLLAGQLDRPGLRADPLRRPPVARRRVWALAHRRRRHRPWSVVLIGLRLWSTRSERPALEAAFLQGAWYINELYDAVFGRPERAAGRLLRRRRRPQGHRRRRQRGGRRWSGARARCCGAPRPGTCATTCSGIVLGTVLVLGFMLTRLWWALMGRLLPLPDRAGPGAGQRAPLVVALVPDPGGGRLVPRGARRWR